MFATENLSVYTDLSIAAWTKYCDHFSYGFQHYSEPYFDDLHLAWSKIKSVEVHLSESEADYILMVDADTIPTSLEISVDKLVDEYIIGERRVIFQKDGSDRLGIHFAHNIPMAFKLRKMVLPNAGFILMCNDAVVLAFFKEWVERAHTSPLASKPPRNQNVLNFEMLNRPVLNKRVGYFDTSVVNKFQGNLAQHFSSMQPELVRQKMQPYYEKLMVEANTTSRPSSSETPVLSKKIS